jgi:hypothetical protein
MFNCFNSWQNMYPFKIVRYKDKTKTKSFEHHHRYKLKQKCEKLLGVKIYLRMYMYIKGGN